MLKSSFVTDRFSSGLLLGIIALCALQVPAPGSDAAPVQSLLHFAAIIDGTGEALTGREIVVEDGIIVAVGDALQERYPNARQIELKHLTAMPGLIDTHVHATYGLNGPSRGDAWQQLLEETPPQERLDAGIGNAAKMLENGITTARDLFALDGVDFQLRELIEQGIVPGPRLYLSGTGIHPMAMPAYSGEAERIASLIQRANAVADSGADWLKIFATTGSASDLSGEQVYGYSEIKAATDAAHARGLRVALHAYGPSAVPDAIRAGVDSIEHAVGVDEKTLRTWAASGIFYIPTIDHNRYYADHRNEYGYDEIIERELRAFTKRNTKTLRRAYQVGVPVAFGSDAVMSMFGQNTRELERFVEAGMSPAHALQAATQSAAKLLGQQDQLGRIAPGFAADIIAVTGQPLKDITAITQNVMWVMKGGEVVIDKANQARTASN